VRAALWKLLYDSQRQKLGILYLSGVASIGLQDCASFGKRLIDVALDRLHRRITITG
jgi:hypothetical protein